MAFSTNLQSRFTSSLSFLFRSSAPLHIHFFLLYIHFFLFIAWKYDVNIVLFHLYSVLRLFWNSPKTNFNIHKVYFLCLFGFLLVELFALHSAIHDSCNYFLVLLANKLAWDVLLAGLLLLPLLLVRLLRSYFAHFKLFGICSLLKHST